jgi:RNA-directed DNA polymerase
MPIRHGNLFERVADLDALYAAYRTARKGKGRKRPIQDFEKDLGANLLRLERELKDGTYHPGPYHQFWVYEPKPRLISAPEFRDVVVQHAVYAIIYPIFDRTFCHDAYGCRVGKGHHRASDRVQHFLRGSHEGTYTLQMDIRKYFYRIDRKILMEQIERRIKDARLLRLIEAFARFDEPVGVPIGNLLSQLFSSVYLDDLDQMVKRELKISRYARYVDDSLIVGVTKARAHELLREIESWLKKHLHLELSRWTIAPIRRGVNFVGFRTWARLRFLRKHSLYNYSRKLRKGLVPNLVSILGNARHTASHAHLCRRMIQERPDLIVALPRPVSARVTHYQVLA